MYNIRDLIYVSQYIYHTKGLNIKITNNNNIFLDIIGFNAILLIDNNDIKLKLNYNEYEKEKNNVIKKGYIIINDLL